MVFIKSVFIYPGYAVAQLTLIPRPGNSRSIWSARASLPGRSRHIRWSAVRPTDVRRIIRSRSGKPLTRSHTNPLFSVASRPCGVPLSRPSRAIGLTGPCDLYRTEHSSVPPDYSAHIDTFCDLCNRTTGFKIAVLTHKVLCGVAPRYLRPLNRVADDRSIWSTLSPLLWYQPSRCTSLQTFYHRQPSFSGCRRQDLERTAEQSRLHNVD